MGFETRTRETLIASLNTSPKPECIIQNQKYLLEVLCDIRDELKEVLNRLSWLKEMPTLSELPKIEYVQKAANLGLLQPKLMQKILIPETVPVTTKKPEPEDLPEWLGGGEEEETI